jgi:hypothetical protein
VPQFEREIKLNFTVPGNYTLFLMLFTDDVPPTPDPQPYDPTYNFYHSVEATNRVLACINHEITYLQMNIEVY